MSNTTERKNSLKVVFGKRTRVDRTVVGTILQAFDDIRDKIILPPCPNCGGHLFFIDKSMGGGIKCCGHKSVDIGGEPYYDVDNGCGFHGFTKCFKNPIELERF